MDKAEEAKKEISQLRTRRQNAIDDARITYLEGFIAGSEYAQQVSKEVAEAAYNDGYNNGYNVNFYDNEPIDFEVWWEYWQKLEKIGQ